jgi:hypothetical protein
MTAKQKLRNMIEELSEAEAATMLDAVVAIRRDDREPATAQPQPRPGEPPRSTRQPRRRPGRLGKLGDIVTIPAWLFVGLFLSLYAAMAIVIVVLVVRAL